MKSINAQSSSTATIDNYEIEIAGSEYSASGFARFFTGDHWRNLWITPIKVEVLDLNSFAGSLTPTERGGGQQTKSLHFIGGDGRRYKFRSINKDVGRSLPPDFKGSVVDNLLQDQVSVTNPVSAVVVALLMDAVGILNAKPYIFLMPDDEKLGEFREEFANLLGTVEENPDDYDDESLNFANADKIVNTFKLFNKLQDDNDEIVDAAEYSKARLLDILIGDRDRHAGQWKWAGYKEGKKRIWKPIPKDRDFAFPLYDGVIPKAMTVAITSMVNFGYDMPSMIDMTWEGRHLDRRLLGSIDKPVWDSVANFMQNKITDEVIEDAVKQLPPEYYKLEGEHLISKLKSRRDQLFIASDNYYKWIAKYADIYMSDKREYAVINRVNDLYTEVIIYKRNKKTGDKKGKPVYSRVFRNTVTDEIRLHLLGGDDIAIVNGEVYEGCRVIIEGGEGDDELIDNSVVNGYFWGFTPFPKEKKKTEFYDSGDSTIFLETAATYINTDKHKLPKDPHLRYEPLIEDRYFDVGVLVPFGYDTDDGFILGIGGRLNFYDFKIKPYDYRLDLYGSYATITKRFEFVFNGDFNNMIGGMNVKIPAKFTGLEITRFYGFGNNTARNDSLVEADFYNVSQRYAGLGFYFTIPIVKHFELNAGLLFEYSNVKKQETTLLGQLNPYGVGIFDFLAISTALKYDNRDDIEMPSKGYFISMYGDVYPTTINNTDFFGKVIVDGRTYLSSYWITDYTLAFRAYGEATWGKYPFYKGASIGGKKTLRGFPRDRFVADYAVLGEAELRFFISKLFILIPFDFGMNLFVDSGRVFLIGESSNRWHTSFGAGFWGSIYQKSVNFSLNFAKSPETFRVYLSIGQMF
ncbi:MAG: BamA/TamA family outer membrane protein [Ignavibacterium sp.]|nr:MAG: BamA/TamA family outer membrane protein [Ignavibacterium sp.]